MKNIFLLQRIKKNEGSVLVGVVLCVMLFFLCLSMVSGVYFDTLHAIHLEKNQRIGKIMIHSVWQELRKKENVENGEVLFNVGVVDISVSDERITLTSRLHDGYTIEQQYARVQNKVVSQEKRGDMRE